MRSAHFTVIHYQLYAVDTSSDPGIGCSIITAKDTHMPKVKYTQLVTTVSGAIADAYGEFQSLRDELSEWRDNLEEKLSYTDKYQQVSDATDILDGFADNEPDVDTSLGDIAVTATHGRKPSNKSPYPRWLRRDNAVALLDGAISSLEDHIATLEERIDATEAFIHEFEEADAERTAEIATAMADYELEEISTSILEMLRDQLESERLDAEELRDQLDSEKAEAESVEFHGMYG